MMAMRADTLELDVSGTLEDTIDSPTKFRASKGQYSFI